MSLVTWAPYSIRKEKVKLTTQLMTENEILVLNCILFCIFKCGFCRAMVEGKNYISLRSTQLLLASKIYNKVNIIIKMIFFFNNYTDIVLKVNLNIKIRVHSTGIMITVQLESLSKHFPLSWWTIKTLTAIHNPPFFKEH